MNKPIKTLFLLLMAVFSVSCNSITDSGVAELSSHEDRGETEANHKLSNCSSFDRLGTSIDTDLEGKVKAFENAVGDVDYRYLRLKFTKVPRGFNTDNMIIRFFRGKQDIGDSVSEFSNSFHGQQLTFDVERAENHLPSMVSFENQELRNESEILGGFSLTDINIVLNFDINSLGYQALQIVIYKRIQEDRDGDGIAESYLEAKNNAVVLAPPFLASADHYSERQAGKDILVSLHPFAYNIGNGISEADYYNQSLDACF